MLIQLSYIDLCKISVLYGSLSTHVFSDKNAKCFRHLNNLLHYENEYRRWYSHKDNLLAGTIIYELRALKEINGEN